MDENIFQIGAEVSHQAKTKAKARAKVKVSGNMFLAEREKERARGEEFVRGEARDPSNSAH